MGNIKLYLLKPTDNQSVRQIIWTEHEKDALQAASFTLEHAKAIREGQKVLIPLAKNYECQLLSDPKDYKLVRQRGNLISILFEGREFHLYYRLAKKLNGKKQG